MAITSLWLGATLSHSMFRLLSGKQIPMLVAVAVSKVSHDIPPRVDPIGISRNSSRGIDGNRSTSAQQKTMTVTVGVNRSPYDIASRVHSNCKGLLGSGYIDRPKYSPRQ